MVALHRRAFGRGSPHLGEVHGCLDGLFSLGQTSTQRVKHARSHDSRERRPLIITKSKGRVSPHLVQLNLILVLLWSLIFCAPLMPQH